MKSVKGAVKGAFGGKIGGKACSTPPAPAGKTKSAKDAQDEKEKKEKDNVAKLKDRQATRTLDPQLDDQFATGRLYACISSRPGQCGRCDGYILEGKELEFYSRQLAKKKSAKK